MTRVLRAYGFCVAAPGLDLPGEEDARGEAPDVVVALADPVAAFSGPCVPPRAAARRADGMAVRYERGQAGDVLITWEGGGRFRIGPHAHEILVAGSCSAAWKRFLLDSVLATAALVAGREALHAGAVQLGDRALVVTAGEGGGKTTLLAALIARGAALVADDICVLSAAGAIEAGPPVLNLADDSPVDAAAVGTELAHLGGERWLLAHRAANGPVPAGAVVLLERRAGARVAAEQVEATPLPLLAGLLDSGDERRRARFDAASTLASSVPLVRLQTGLNTPPDSALAALRPWVDDAPPRAPRYFTG